MSSQQITMWLQGLFLFAVVWTLGGTITGDSRKKFDAFYRSLIMGMDDKYPLPKSIKLKKNNFPERGHKISWLCLFIVIIPIKNLINICNAWCLLSISQALFMTTIFIRMDKDSGIFGLIQSQMKKM